MIAIYRPNISDNTGTGADRKGTRRDGLKLAWKWVRQCDLSQAPYDDTRRLPCQTCYAEFATKSGSWKFQAIDCGSLGYEAIVSFDHEMLLFEGEFSTRLDAQLRAESMLVEFLKSALKEVEDFLGH